MNGAAPSSDVLLRQASRNSLTQFLLFLYNSASGLAAAWLLTHALTIDDYGQFTLWFRTYSWLCALAVFLLPLYMVQRVASLHARGDAPAIRRLVLASYAQQGAVILLGAGVAWLLAPSDGGERGMLLAVVVGFAAMALSQVPEALMKGMHLYGGPARAQALSTAVKLAGFALLFLLTERLLAALVIVAAASVVQYFGNAVMSRGLIQGGSVAAEDVKAAPLQEARAMAVIAAVSLLSLVHWGYVEVFMISWMWEGREGRGAELAAYGLAIALAALPLRLSKTLSTPLLPLFASLRTSGEHLTIEGAYRAAIETGALLGLLVCPTLALAAGPLLLMLFPAELSHAVVPLIILTFPSLVLAICNPGSVALVGMRFMRAYLVVNILAAVLNTALDLWLIPEHGAVGAATVNAIVQSLASVGPIVVMHLRGSLRFPGGSVALLAGVAAVSSAAPGALLMSGVLGAWGAWLAPVLYAGAYVALTRAKWLGLMARRTAIAGGGLC